MLDIVDGRSLFLSDNRLTPIAVRLVDGNIVHDAMQTSIQLQHIMKGEIGAKQRKWPPQPSSTVLGDGTSFFHPDFNDMQGPSYPPSPCTEMVDAAPCPPGVFETSLMQTEQEIRQGSAFWRKAIVATIALGILTIAISAKKMIKEKGRATKSAESISAIEDNEININNPF